MTLGRPFKAGKTSNTNRVASATPESKRFLNRRDDEIFLSPSQALKGVPKFTRHYVLYATPALKGRPKITRRYAT